MKFIKRIVFIIILLLLAFFVYRLINPSAAKTLVQDVKTLSNDKLGTHFALTVVSEEILIEPSTPLEETGSIINETGVLQEFDDGDTLLLHDNIIEDNLIENTVIETIVADPVIEELVTTEKPVTTPIKKSKPATPSKTEPTLSKQQERDLQNLLNNLSVN